MIEKEHAKSLAHLKGRFENSLGGFLWACMIGLLVAFQFALLIVLPFLLRGFTTWFYVVMEITSLLFILALTNDNRSGSYKLAWCCIVLFLPISGFIMFSLWGKTGKTNKLHRRIRDKIIRGNRYLVQEQEVLDSFCKKHPVTSRMSRYMSAVGAPLWKNNKGTYYPMGEDAFEAIFQDLEQAKHFILINFYIVAEGALWDRTHEILLRKIKEGVEVRFMYDDFGALLRTPRDFSRKLRAEGFQIAIFNPVHKYTAKLFMNFRSHQKIVVIDGNIGYTGGFNMADEYANLIERFGVWKDAGIRLEGEGVWGLTVVFLSMWNVCTNSDDFHFDVYRPTKKFEENNFYCHVLSDGPALSPEQYVETMYKQMINYSGKKLYIMTPYLILEEYMIQSLVEAVRRGVDVRIITPRIPDKKKVKWLTEYNYGELLKNGVRIFEYKPGFIHSKVIMSEHSCIIGTVNMDYRSFYLHYENGIWVYDEKLLCDVNQDFEQTFQESIEISYTEWLNRPARLKSVQYILNVFSTLV